MDESSSVLASETQSIRACQPPSLSTELQVKRCVRSLRLHAENHITFSAALENQVFVLQIMPVCFCCIDFNRVIQEVNVSVAECVKLSKNTKSAIKSTKKDVLLKSKNCIFLVGQANAHV